MRSPSGVRSMASCLAELRQRRVGAHGLADLRRGLFEGRFFSTRLCSAAHVGLVTVSASAGWPSRTTPDGLPGPGAALRPVCAAGLVAGRRRRPDRRPSGPLPGPSPDSGASGLSVTRRDRRRPRSCSTTGRLPEGSGRRRGRTPARLIERGMAAERLAGAGGACDSMAIGAEVVGEALALVLGGGVQQPHQQEERHHGGDEIGVGDLPGAAVMAALGDLVFFDDNLALGALLAMLARHVYLPEAGRMTGKH